MSRRKHFSLLVVRADGARILRCNFPQTLVIGVVVGAVVVSLVVGALAADWFLLRRVTREARPYVDQVAAQKVALDVVNAKVRELRQEVSGWRDVHVRLLETLGPEGTPGSRDKGIGGPSTPVDRLPVRLSPTDELNRLSDSIAEESQSLKALDRLMARAAKMLASLPSRWPVRGAVNSEFGNRPSPWTKAIEFHSGLDIRAEKGTAVRAPASGDVVFAGPHAEYGIAVIIDHGHDIRTIYGHLSKLDVASGQHVERGMPVGLTGNTGRSSGPHLHYEIVVKGQAVNPRGYLWD